MDNKIKIKINEIKNNLFDFISTIQPASDFSYLFDKIENNSNYFSLKENMITFYYYKNGDNRLKISFKISNKEPSLIVDSYFNFDLEKNYEEIIKYNEAYSCFSKNLISFKENITNILDKNNKILNKISTYKKENLQNILNLDNLKYLNKNNLEIIKNFNNDISIEEIISYNVEEEIKMTLLLTLDNKKINNSSLLKYYKSIIKNKCEKEKYKYYNNIAKIIIKNINIDLIKKLYKINQKKFIKLFQIGFIEPYNNLSEEEYIDIIKFYYEIGVLEDSFHEFIWHFYYYNNINILKFILSLDIKIKHLDTLKTIMLINQDKKYELIELIWHNEKLKDYLFENDFELYSELKQIMIKDKITNF